MNGKILEETQLGLNPDGYELMLVLSQVQYDYEQTPHSLKVIFLKSCVNSLLCLDEAVNSISLERD
jgi:hypothetical protein